MTRAEVRRFRRSRRADPAYSDLGGLLQALIAGVGVLVVAFLLVRATGASALTVTLLALVVGAVAWGLVSASSGLRWRRRARLHAFGEANGLAYTPQSPAGGYPGAIFDVGSSRTTLDTLRRLSPRALDYGNLRYTTGSGKQRRTHHWGYLALQLDRRLPHMVLDARANNGLFGATSLPTAFSRDQVLSLEGDFDRHFTLYCPREYERDALYVFTPDLMALLIDESSAYDVEIVENWMFVYSTSPFELTAAATHHRLLRIVDTVGAKTITQTDRYADERIGDRTVDLVAPRGQRLRSGAWWAAPLAVLAIVGVLLWLLVSFLTSM